METLSFSTNKSKQLLTYERNGHEHRRSRKRGYTPFVQVDVSQTQLMLSGSRDWVWTWKLSGQSGLKHTFWQLWVCGWAVLVREQHSSYLQTNARIWVMQSSLLTFTGAVKDSPRRLRDSFRKPDVVIVTWLAWELGITTDKPKSQDHP